MEKDSERERDIYIYIEREREEEKKTDRKTERINNIEIIKTYYS